MNVTLHGGVDLDVDQIADALRTGVNANVGLTANIDAGLGNVRSHIDAGLNDIRITELPPIGTQPIQTGNPNTPR